MPTIGGSVSVGQGADEGAVPHGGRVDPSRQTTFNGTHPPRAKGTQASGHSQRRASGASADASLTTSTRVEASPEGRAAESSHDEVAASSEKAHTEVRKVSTAGS